MRDLQMGIVTVMLFVMASWAIAAEPAPEVKGGGRPALTVAVLDFQADTPGNPELGKQIGEALTATLSAESSIRLVDRASMSKALSEQELNLTGLVSTDQAITVGKLVGAKLLVVGRAFVVDKQLFLTAKLIGTETSLVRGVMVKGGRDGDTSALVMELAERVAGSLRDAGPSLVAPKEDRNDPLAAIRQKLAGRKLPAVALKITEQHVSQARTVDPPVETELEMMLTDCGFAVYDGSDGAAGASKAEITIRGEAVSEFAARVGNLVSCTARAEVKVVAADGRTVFAQRTTARAADLSEQIAAKAALQKAGHEAGLKVLEFLAQ